MPRLGSLAPLVVLVAIAAAAPMALAGWGPDGVTVRPITAYITVVAACTDGGSGTYVAWQETSNYVVGLLRVQHLLSTGDLDPAWPADGVVASDVAVERGFVDVLPDRLGGIYVCWMETSDSSTMFVTRLDPSGQVAAGWPASGKSLGAGSLVTGRPRAIEDASHGVFLAWTTGGSVVAQHLGPDGLGAGGWPDGSLRATPSAPASRIYFWPDLALGPGGGVFASWAAGSPYVADNGGMYVRRLTGAGDNSPGWPTEGMYLGSFPTDVALDFPQAPLLDISPDDRGGLLCIVGSVNGYVADVRLHRMLADGTTSPGWPDGGRVLPWYPDGYGYYEYAGPDDGLRVYPDGQDGVLVESLVTSVHSWDMGYSRCSDGGQWSMLMQDFPTGHEVVTKGDGGAFVASFKPAGPFNRYEPEAFLAVDQSYPPPGWTEWRETQTQAAVGWYGDIALAPAGDGGVVFFWSQHRERFGLFARKFTTAGQVTAVAPGPGAETGPLGLHGLRFVSGTGVVARVAGTCQRL